MYANNNNNFPTALGVALPVAIFAKCDENPEFATTVHQESLIPCVHDSRRASVAGQETRGQDAEEHSLHALVAHRERA